MPSVFNRCFAAPKYRAVECTKDEYHEAMEAVPPIVLPHCWAMGEPHDFDTSLREEIYYWFWRDNFDVPRYFCILAPVSFMRAASILELRGHAGKVVTHDGHAICELPDQKRIATFRDHHGFEYRWDSMQECWANSSNRLGANESGWPLAESGVPLVGTLKVAVHPRKRVQSHDRDEVSAESKA